MLRRPLTLIGALLGALVLAAPAHAAVPDRWVRWVNVPDNDPNRDVRSTWVRSLDFIGSQLFAASEGDGVFASPSAVGPWSAVNGGLDDLAKRSVRQIASSGGRLYAATTAGLFRSVPGGSWEPVGQGTGARKLNMGGIQAIHFTTPTDQEIVVGTASFGIWYSSDMGEHWDKAGGLPPATSVFNIASNPGVVYAASTHGVYRSTDAGRSWILASDGIPPSEQVLRVVVTPGSPNVLWASTTSAVYRSSNAGVTWSNVEGSGDSALPSGQFRALLAGPSQLGGGRFVAGTEFGAWATRDDGKRWGQMSPETLIDPDPADPAPDPLPFGQQIVWSLAVGAGGSEDFNLIAGTQASGAYSIDLQRLQNTAAPTVSPTTGLQAGERLTATPGGWTGTRPFFFDHQWMRCPAAGGSCSTIAGAKARTYALTASDIGHKIAVQVVARNLVPPDPATVQSAAYPASGTVAAAPATAPFPVNPASSPSIAPNPVTPSWGQTYTINNGTWRTSSTNPVSPTFAYQWQRCNAAGSVCEDIPGADGQSYATVPAEVGGKVRAFITATYQGASDTRVAGISSTIVEKTPVNTEKPRIVGEPYNGRVLSSNAGGWQANNPRFERRWLRCEADGLGCNPIVGQTGVAYTATAADRGKRLQLEVTAIVEDPNQDRETIEYSEPTPVITDPPPDPIDPGPTPNPQPQPEPQPLPQPQPQPRPRPLKVAISAPKRLKVGARLSVPARIAGFSKLRYQWYRSGKKIKKAKKRIYKLTRRDRGKRISCRIKLTPAVRGAPIVIRTKAIKVPRRLG